MNKLNAGVFFIVESVKNIAVKDEYRLYRTIFPVRMIQAAVIFEPEIPSEPENRYFVSYALSRSPLYAFVMHY